MWMCSHGSTSRLSVSESFRVRGVDLDAVRCERERGRPLASTAAALRRDSGRRPALGPAWGLSRLREWSEASLGRLPWGERDDALGLKPPGLALLRAFCKWGVVVP